MHDENEHLPASQRDIPTDVESTHDPDLARLIELVERIGGHGEQPL